MSTKNIDRKTHVAAHVGVIVYHTLVGILLVLTRYYESILSIKSRTFVMILGVILIITSLLALMPVLKKYDKIIIE